MALDPQSQAVINAMYASGAMPFRKSPIADVRELILKIRAARPAKPTYEMFKVSEEAIDVDGGSIPVRILQPRKLAEGERLPVVVYFHGGGYVLGDLEQNDEFLRQLAVKADVTIVNVAYRLSPEVKFPTAINDGYAAICWVAAQADRLAVDPKKLIVAGDSAGGNLLIAACLMAKERGGPEILFQVPIYPSLDLRSRPTYPSRLKWGEKDHLLENDDIEWMMDLYFADPNDANDWRASPILAASYEGLPPALVVTADHDPLVDEGQIYADRLAADGVPVEYACFEGTFHGFLGFTSVLDVGAKAADLICNRVRAAVAA